jgi:hypothetical protein
MSFRERPLALVLVVVSAMVAAQCRSRTEAAREPPSPVVAAVADQGITPVLSVKELMEHVIDPTADWIFDAAVIDVNPAGVQTVMPVSEEDWLKVERGALLLAESSNLLKMPRAMVPPGTPVNEQPREPGKPAPELSPAEIEAKINHDRALWNSHADELRKVALDSLKVVKARNAEGLFQIGSDIDKACESCHLEFWYPGDKAAVLADQQKKVTFDPLRK